MTGPVDGAAAPIRVLVVDDQELVRSGFCVILDSADGIEVAGEAANGEAAGTFLDNEQVDAISVARPCTFGSNEHEVRHVGIRAPDLGSFQVVTARDARGSGLDPLDVRAALRLGGGKGAAQLARGQAR